MARITVPFLCLMAAAMGVGAASKGNALPPLAQKIDQRSFNVLQTVPPATDMDGLAVCLIYSLCEAAAELTLAFSSNSHRLEQLWNHSPTSLSMSTMTSFSVSSVTTQP